MNERIERILDGRNFHYVFDFDLFSVIVSEWIKQEYNISLDENFAENKQRLVVPLPGTARILSLAIVDFRFENLLEWFSFEVLDMEIPELWFLLVVFNIFVFGLFDAEHAGNSEEEELELSRSDLKDNFVFWWLFLFQIYFSNALLLE